MFATTRQMLLLLLLLHGSFGGPQRPSDVNDFDVAASTEQSPTLLSRPRRSVAGKVGTAAATSLFLTLLTEGLKRGIEYLSVSLGRKTTREAPPLIEPLGEALPATTKTRSPVVVLWTYQTPGPATLNRRFASPETEGTYTKAAVIPNAQSQFSRGTLTENAPTTFPKLWDMGPERGIEGKSRDEIKSRDDRVLKSGEGAGRSSLKEDTQKQTTVLSSVNGPPVAEKEEGGIWITMTSVSVGVAGGLAVLAFFVVRMVLQRRRRGKSCGGKRSGAYYVPDGRAGYGGPLVQQV
ncbi:hypothetical protein BV898_08197 [Hypsibius exemplaris]|uniref:Syndecan/Neurexin domain-containing protein n=1 Tax=Hypsibius exemplaris TaxID=2072580 RepID=A0A1W0WRB6_HYPEX|nr:hypothetical protein BV898_08197 [Hypsibius exemplaris]